MLSRVSTVRRASLFLHSLHPRTSFYPLPALAASNEVKHISGRAPYLCRDVNTGSHLFQAPCNNGGHGPVCKKTEGHPLAYHDLCRDDQAPKISKKKGSDEPQPSACIQSYVKLSASTARRKKGYSSHGNVQAVSPKIVTKEGCGEAQPDADVQSYVRLSTSPAGKKKGHSSHGNGKVSVLIDANGHASDVEAKVSESHATPSCSKASRRKVHVSSREVKLANSTLKLSSSKASKKTIVLSYGDVKVSESETCNQDADSDPREGNVKILTCEACRDAQGDFGYSDSEATAKSAELHSPSSSNDHVMLPVTQGQEEFPSLVPCVLPRNNFEGRRAVRSTFSADGFAAALTSKSKDNCVPSHVSNASSSGSLYPYPSMPLQDLLISTLSKGKDMSQVAMFELQRKVELLEAEKMSVNDAQVLFKTMAFKSSSLEQLSAMLQVLKEFFGTGGRACEVLTNSSKKLLLHPVDLLQQKLKVLADFEIDKETVSRLFTCRQALLSQKVEVLQKNLSFFKELGLTVEALNKMCQRDPRILSRSVENCVLPTLEFLECTELTREGLLKLLRGRPRIFSDCDDSLVRKYKHFRQLGFSAHILNIAFHYLHQFSIEKLQAHFQSIKDLGSDEDVQLMIRKQPSLLAQSPESLRARYYYLVHEQNRDMVEVLKCPSCLMYSLHGRIIPRFAILKKSGLPRVYSLSTILCITDLQFKNKFRVV